MQSTSRTTKPAPLPPLPSPGKTPNIFADLAQGAAPQRSDRNDPTCTAVVGRQHRSVALTAVVAGSALQTRAPFSASDDQDQALIASIELEGQQMPVVLERLPDRQPPEYRILDGHRRIAALRHLGRPQVEAIIVQAGTEDGDLLTLTANVRRNLTPLEWLKAIDRLEARGMTHAEIGRRIGWSRRYIDELSTLRRLTEPLQNEMLTGHLGAKAAIEWARVPPEHHAALAQLCAAGEVTVAQAQTIAEQILAGRTVAEAAEAVGCVAEAADEGADSSAGQPASSKARKSKPNRVLGLDATGELLHGYFPDMDVQAARNLAEAAVRRRTPEAELKTAGCLVAAGMAAAEALSLAHDVAGRPWARKVVSVLDRVIELEALCTGDRCPPEAAKVFPVLARRVGAVKGLGRAGGRPAGASKATSQAKP